MAPQTYSSHAHRPTLTGVGYLFVVVASVSFVMRWLLIGGRVTMAIGLIGLIGGEIALLMISRNYITKLQDRIIRLEMRVRTASLLTLDQQRLLDKVRIKQLVALRFASDVELPALLDRTVREDLAPTDIKKAIKTWVPDYDRT